MAHKGGVYVFDLHVIVCVFFTKTLTFFPIYFHPTQPVSVRADAP